MKKIEKQKRHLIEEANKRILKELNPKIDDDEIDNLYKDPNQTELPFEDEDWRSWSDEYLDKKTEEGMQDIYGMLKPVFDKIHDKYGQADWMDWDEEIRQSLESYFEEEFDENWGKH